MNIDIRKNIINNFKSSDESEIKDSISCAINDENELTLPGLGVMFEILWKNSSEQHKEDIVNILKSNIS